MAGRANDRAEQHRQGDGRQGSRACERFTSALAGRPAPGQAQAAFACLASHLTTTVGPRPTSLSADTLLLEFGALLKSHTLPLWLGGAQAKANGWFPRKGSSAVRIVRPRAVGLAGLALLWMPPTLWQAVHNREHHGHTNSLRDPDRSYLERQPASWGKWIQHRFTPSDEVSGIGLVLSLASAWGVHNLRTIASVLLVPDGSAAFPPAPFRVSRRERRRIALELLAIVGLHAAVVASLGAGPLLLLLLGYFLPIWIGYAGAIAYIYTNHLLCPLGRCNDPLANTLSLRLPPLLDLLHLNFSHHVEHHIFPGLNSSHYPQVRRLLQERYPDRYQLLDGGAAWRLLLATPRH